jgi:hypothetical protein
MALTEQGWSHYTPSTQDLMQPFAALQLSSKMQVELWK